MRPRRRQRAPRRQKWLRPSPWPPLAAMLSVATSSVLLEGLLRLSDVLAGLLPKRPRLFTVNLHLPGLLACSLLIQPHLIWRKGAGPRRGVTGAVTSARCVSAGEGKVWPVRGAGVEGGTEGPGPGEAPQSLLQRRPRTGLGPGRGVPDAEEQEARSAGASSPRRSAAPPRGDPAPRRPADLVVLEEIGGVAAAAVGGGERRGEERREVSELEGGPRARLPSCPRTRAPCPGPSTGTTTSCRR